MSNVAWARLQSLFDVALSLRPSERDEYLGRECGTDTVLRGQIDSLIAASVEAGDRVDAVASLAAQELAPAATVGQRVGPWQLVEEIGRGGMGAVFLATRADGEYAARAAIKLIGGIRTAEHLRRFRVERQILAGLDHPGIARLLDGGSTAGGVPWVAMELVEGVPLDVYCERANLSIERRIALFLDVCGAVGYAHRHLVVHRDLKPGNILVTADGIPKLLDFGIAKLLGDDEAPAAATRTGIRMFTPEYGSPEQLRGEAVTVSADVYALGVVLFQLLAGRMPFALDDASLAEIELQILEADAPRASAAAVSPRAARRLRGDLDAIIATALRKEPASRYASVDRLADDLKRHLSGLPVQAQGEAWSYRAWKFTRRHRIAATIAATSLVLLTGFTGALAFQNQRLTTERNAATLASARAEQIASFMGDVFTVSDPERARGDTVTARALLDAGARRVELELAGQPELQSAMMQLIGRTYYGLGLTDQARTLLEQALALRERLHGAVHLDVASSQLDVASVLQQQGDVERAEPLYRQALATRRQLLGEEHPDVSAAVSELAFLLETKGDDQGAETLYRIAVEQDSAADPPDREQLAKSLLRLGNLLRQRGSIEEAEPMLRQALAVLRTHHGRDHPDVASAARALAALLRDRSAFAESEALFAEVIDIRRRVLGEEHPDVAVAMNSHAMLLLNTGDTDRAIGEFAAAMDISQRSLGAEHPAIAAGYHNIATALSDAGLYDEALAQFAHAIEAQDLVLDLTHPDRAHPRLGIASVYRRQGRCAEALPWMREALALRRTLAPDHRYVAQTLRDLGDCLTQVDRHDEAARALREAHAIYSATREPGDPDLVRTQRLMLELARRAGRPELADEGTDPLPQSSS